MKFMKSYPQEYRINHIEDIEFCINILHPFHSLPLIDCDTCLSACEFTICSMNGLNHCIDIVRIDLHDEFSFKA